MNTSKKTATANADTTVATTAARRLNPRRGPRAAALLRLPATRKKFHLSHMAKVRKNGKQRTATHIRHRVKRRRRGAAHRPRHAGASHLKSKALFDSGHGLVEVGNDVVHALDAHREADEIGGYARLAQLLIGELTVRMACGV